MRYKFLFKIRMPTISDPILVFRPMSSIQIRSDLHITIVCWFSFLLAVAVPFPTMVHFCITKKLKHKRGNIKEITF